MPSLSIEHKIKLLTDNLSFIEIGAHIQSRLSKSKENGDGVVCGYATIEQQKVMLIIQNSNYLNGTMGEAHCNKMAAAVDKAMELKLPIVIIFESAGVRIQEGILAMNPAGLLFNNLAKASGILPMIAIMLGANSGAASYSAALMDFIIMENHSSAMFLTGPKVIEKVVNEKVSIQELGGSDVHAKITGLASIIVVDEIEAFAQAKRILSFLTEPKEVKKTKEKKQNINQHIVKKYNNKELQDLDMYELIQHLTDENSFLEINKLFAENCIVGFATLNKIKIGIIANQPKIMSGSIDVLASKKMTRFLQICDAYNIPTIFLADTPGFLPGKKEEHTSILGVGAKILSVLANSTNAKITIIVGKAFGGAYGAMCPKTLGADYVFAWHNAQIGVLGAEAAMNLIYAKQIEAHKNDENYIQKLKEDYINNSLSPYIVAENGLIDGIIFPEETREIIAKCLNSLKLKAVKSNVKKRTIFPMG